MKRLLAILALLAALLAIALPAQAATGHRYHLGTVASATELASFGCGYDSEGPAVLLRHHGHYTIARTGTVKHPKRIVEACRFATPQAIPKSGTAKAVSSPSGCTISYYYYSPFGPTLLPYQVNWYADPTCPNPDPNIPAGWPAPTG